MYWYNKSKRNLLGLVNFNFLLYWYLFFVYIYQRLVFTYIPTETVCIYQYYPKSTNTWKNFFITNVQGAERRNIFYDYGWEENTRCHFWAKTWSIEREMLMETWICGREIWGFAIRQTLDQKKENTWFHFWIETWSVRCWILGFITAFGSNGIHVLESNIPSPLFQWIFDQWNFTNTQNELN
jgi:hypothetical protein